MSTILNTERLLKRALLTNIYIEPGKPAITPILSGQHGFGKSAICRKVASDIGGIAITVEGGSLKEGEITGLPFAKKDSDGQTTVRFVPYYAIAKIQKLEKYIYNKAKTTGLLNGSLKIDENGNTVLDGEIIVPAKSECQIVADGEDNMYKFGEELPADLKFKLLHSHDIDPVVLFIDEMNRTDGQTMKEMMNIVLNRHINGYDFPWWVFIVSAINPCGQDSVYATNEMDDAQRDRFLRIKVEANLEEWGDYAIDGNLNQDYIMALSNSADIFYTAGKGHEESVADDMTPSPRSHEICSYIYGYAKNISNSGYFSAEEIAKESEDVRTLIQGKIGIKAGSAILTAIRNIDSLIKPEDLLNGKTAKISEAYEAKIHRMVTIGRRILGKNILRYIATTAYSVYDAQRSAKPETAQAAKTKWANMLTQLKSALSAFDDATTLVFAKESLTVKVAGGSLKDKAVFKLIVGCFSTDIIAQMSAFTTIENTGALNN